MVSNFTFAKFKLLTFLFLNCFWGSFFPLQSQWQIQWQGNDALNSICFVNQNTGWAVGHRQIILKTTNGGLNWFTQYYGNSFGFSSVCFIDLNTGWTVASTLYPVPNTVYLKTSNSGTNWISQSICPNYGFSSIFFIDQNTGWAVGGGGVLEAIIVKTSNGGINWNVQYNVWSSVLYSVNFIDHNYGWAAGDGILLRTTNGGDNWICQQVISAPSKVQFINQVTGWLIGFQNILKSSDGGINWVNQYTGNEYLSSLYFINQNIGWVGGNGIILKTSNGGMNWLPSFYPPGPFNTVYSIYFLDQNYGWAATGQDASGKIYGTTNGGITGFPNNYNEIPKSFSLSQNYPNPFNSSTFITYALPVTSNVTLKIYEITGKLVANPVNANQPAGEYKISFDADNFASGVYFNRLEAGDYVCIKKMVLVK